MKYESKIVKLGKMVNNFLKEKMIVIFNEGVPEELEEISLLHTKSELKEDIIKGDKLKIGSKEYLITFVGKEVNKTLKELGHCTLKFNGVEKGELPGVISLKGDIGEVKVGSNLSIY